MKYLIVDDSGTMRRVLRKVLTMAGAADVEVGEAVDGEEALELIAAQRPQLVLCDLNMPRLGGDGMLDRLQEAPFKPTVVMITSIRSAQTKLRLVRLGAAKVIHKPFEPHQLAVEIQSFVAAVEGAGDAAATFVEDVAAAPSVDAADTIAACVANALETMAFAFPSDDVAPEPPPPSRALFRASIRIGDLGVALYATSDTAAALSERITGDNPGDDDRARLDAIAELANIVAGEAGERLGGDVSLPKTSVVTPGYVVVPLRRHFLDEGLAIFSELERAQPEAAE